MRYRWTAAPGRVVFTRKSNRWIAVLFLAVGLALGGAGAWGIGGRATLAPFAAGFLEVLFAMGAMFVVVAVKWLFSGDRYDPYEIVADGARGHFRIRDDGGAAIEIPFREVRGFDVRVKRLQSSKGTRGVSGEVYHFFGVVQTESASFEVVQSHARQDAERAIEAVRGCVEAATSAPAGTCALPRGLASAGASVRWRNRAAGALVFFLFVAGGLAFVMSRFAALFALEGGDGVMFHVILGFLVLVFGFVVVTNLLRLVRDLRTTYELVVGDGVRYAEYPASAPDAPARKVLAIPSRELARVLFAHEIAEAPAPIRVSSHDVGKETIAVDVVALSATERMMLAVWLRENATPR